MPGNAILFQPCTPIIQRSVASFSPGSSFSGVPECDIAQRPLEEYGSAFVQGRDRTRVCRMGEALLTAEQCRHIRNDDRATPERGSGQPTGAASWGCRRPEPSDGGVCQQRSDRLHQAQAERIGHEQVVGTRDACGTRRTGATPRRPLPSSRRALVQHSARLAWHDVRKHRYHECGRDPQLAHVGAMAFFMYEEAALDHSALVECVPGWMYHDQAAEVAMHRQLQVHPSRVINPVRRLLEQLPACSTAADVSRLAACAQAHAAAFVIPVFPYVMPC